MVCLSEYLPLSTVKVEGVVSRRDHESPLFFFVKCRLGLPVVRKVSGVVTMKSIDMYTDHAGLEISVHLRIAWPFPWQIAIGNTGPISALESMGTKPTFRCHFLNIGPSYKQ